MSDSAMNGPFDELRSRTEHFLESLTCKIANLETGKASYMANSVRNDIREHFEKILKECYKAKKAAVEKQLLESEDAVNKRLNKAFNEAQTVNVRILQDIAEIEELVNLISQLQPPPPRVVPQINGINSDDDIDENMLTINEIDNEFEESNNEREQYKSYQSRLNDCFKRIDELMSTPLEIDNALEMIQNMPKTSFNKSCKPDINGICFGHLDYTNALTSNAIPFVSVQHLNHTQFNMDVKLEECFDFKCSELCQITLNCQMQWDSEDNIGDLFTIDLISPRAEVLRFQFKLSTPPHPPRARILFSPNVVGIHTLIIKFRDIHITGSPFHFVVLPSDTMVSSASNNSIKASKKILMSDSGRATPTHMPQRSVADKLAANENSLATQKRLPFIQPSLFSTTPSPAVVPPDVSLADVSVSPAVTPTSFGFGRGNRYRLMYEEQKSRGLNKGLLLSNGEPRQSHAQKRCRDSQSPRINDHNNNQFADESSMTEISRKLKKVVNVTEKSLIGDHLRKHTATNGLVNLLKNVIPPLRAHYEFTIPNLCFPIGVRPCQSHNLIIVCESGDTNSVKLFQRGTCQLIKELKNCPEYQFKRPSAVLVDFENDCEFYIKDDKEIMVFDLNQDFRLVRRFGLNKLSKPYALAFDSHGNILTIDASMKSPFIVTFDRKTGELLTRIPYQPIMQQFADSTVLKKSFSGRNTDGILSSNPAEFSKSKVRFACCNNDTIYASDLGRSIVFKTDLEGEIMMAFGFCGQSKDHFIQPSGIHVDYDGSAILVGDSKNNRIQIYNNKGQYKCDVQFVGDRVLRPSDIHVDAEGYLYVSCFIGKAVQVFKLESN